MIATALSRLPRGLRTVCACGVVLAEAIAHQCGVHLGLEGLAGPLMTAAASDAE